MRRPLIVANWKMNKTSAEAEGYIRRLASLIHPDSIDLVLAPPFTALSTAAAAVPNSGFELAGQDVFWEDKGAYTGEVSPVMLKEIGCAYVLVGHSERRQWFGETDTWVNKKVAAAIRHGLKPILCLGEHLADREQGLTAAVVSGQLKKGLSGVTTDDLTAIAIAYEPIWAIGTGRAATPDQAEEVHRLLRAQVSVQWGQEAGNRMRILYGGSVTPDNAGRFLASREIDGLLVGGACLDPDCFATIARSAEQLVVQQG
ncbi:triose-phosphate isomerase [Candidatus Nitrospira bockiana]